MTDSTQCPLCNATGGSPFFTDKRREYLRCTYCALVFVPSSFHLSVVKERAEYDKHENAVEDPGYRRFLSRLLVPLNEAIAPASSGLDFGCGPGPALAQMLREGGHSMAIYDPFYAPDTAVLQHSYDFVTATEVVEHMHKPGDDLSRLWSMLRPGGTLAVMTKLVLGAAAFTTWHYKNDPTHVCFFSRETWQWWADQNTAEMKFEGADVILLRK
ncbi:MAG: class I SAM-dependent methyltransferase [Proteobacteria bacterium]|nr:class I SAM-dependent methyltransferase [Pseudomonadota bacterium]